MLAGSPRDANAGHACHSEFSTVGGTQAQCCGGRIGVAEAQRRSERSEPRGLTRRRRFAVAHTGCRPGVRRSVALSVGCRGRATAGRCVAHADGASTR